MFSNLTWVGGLVGQGDKEDTLAKINEAGFGDSLASLQNHLAKWFDFRFYHLCNSPNHPQVGLPFVQGNEEMNHDAQLNNSHLIGLTFLRFRNQVSCRTKSHRWSALLAARVLFCGGSRDWRVIPILN